RRDGHGRSRSIQADLQRSGAKAMAKPSIHRMRWPACNGRDMGEGKTARGYHLPSPTDRHGDGDPRNSNPKRDPTSGKLLDHPSLNPRPQLPLSDKNIETS